MARTPRRPAGGWQPLRSGSGTFDPFTRLARTHAASAAGDALLAIGLAGSLFFSISPEAARERVALYLLLTMAPFAVVAPVLGPLIDQHRGGRRSMVILSLGGRSVLCLLIADHIDGVLLFPLAFGALVLGKAYGVARASLVPAVVDHEKELVQANARLTLVAGLVGFAVAPVGVIVLQVGAAWVMLVAAVVFGAGTVLSLQLLPARPVAPSTDVERDELRGAGVLLAAGAMAVLRGTVGFLSFLIAFALRNDDAPTWWFGIIVATAAVGALSGALVAPVLRRWIREERILLASLIAVSFVALLAMQTGSRVSAALLAGFLGIAASAGRLCFDAIVQRDAPDADRARSFARFETRFQLAWVLGALIPVVVSMPLTFGFGVIAIACTVAAATYLTGRRVPWSSSP
jgi:MFS family permease